MLIRSMTEADILQAAEIEAASITPPWSAQSFLDALKQDTLMMVAVDEDTDRVLGYVNMYVSFEEGEITNVAVDPKVRGGKIASRLMEQFISCAKERGVERIVLEVRISNLPAIGLYRKMGFEKLGIRKNFYEQPREDALIMEKIC